MLLRFTRDALPVHPGAGAAAAWFPAMYLRPASHAPAVHFSCTSRAPAAGHGPGRARRACRPGTPRAVREGQPCTSRPGQGRTAAAPGDGLTAARAAAPVLASPVLAAAGPVTRVASRRPARPATAGEFAPWVYQK